MMSGKYLEQYKATSSPGSNEKFTLKSSIYIHFSVVFTLKSDLYRSSKFYISTISNLF